jgi:N4-gp56 family major capsid protein
MELAIILAIGAILLVMLATRANEHTVASGAPLEDVVRAAYDRSTLLALQPNRYFAQLGSSKTWNSNDIPEAGDTVTFTIYDNLAAATTELSDEYSDVTRVPMGETQVTVTLREYGNVVTTTKKLKITAFDDINTAAATVVGINMADSIDLIARVAFDAQAGASYVRYVGQTALANIIPTDIMTAEEVRIAFNRLDRANVPKIDGFYIAVLHPDCIHDLKNETSASGGTFRAPLEYIGAAKLMNGEIGEFEGFRVVSTTNAKLDADAGTGTTDVYSNYFLGFQAIGYAIGEAPGLVISEGKDNLRRTTNYGWYALVGYGELRAAALHKSFAASSRGAN